MDLMQVEMIMEQDLTLISATITSTLESGINVHP